MKTAGEAELTALNVKLELAARHWRATADAIDDGLLLIDANDNILRMNRAAAAALAATWSVWVGQPSARLATYPPWNDALNLGKPALLSHTIVTLRAHNAASVRPRDICAPPLPVRGLRGAADRPRRDGVSRAAGLRAPRAETMAALAR